ncbi:GDP-fucose transporter 1-like [Arachis ipaensis]|uniref:GDP-fucose transporter 1-like n=1 Tax=Arachis ipaensis TaxID=130454 RepID=UPI000A2B6063|nr:GDP-fucose transporter 1-like [Arachis ipaensis]
MGISGGSNDDDELPAVATVTILQCLTTTSTFLTTTSPPLSTKSHFLVVGYALCSSLSTIINKYAITQFNHPDLLTALQYLTFALGIYLLDKLGFLYHDPFIVDTAKHFFPATLVFFLSSSSPTPTSSAASMSTPSSSSNLSLFSSSPLWIPSSTTCLAPPSSHFSPALLSLLAPRYVAIDSAFTFTIYFWVFAYLITITT